MRSAAEAPAPSERDEIAAELRELGQDPEKVMAGWSGDRSLPVDGDAEDPWAQVPDLVDCSPRGGRTLVLAEWAEPSIEAFLVASTQWRWVTAAVIGPMGVAMFQPMRMGLDYVGAQAAWSLADLQPTPEIFGDVRLMEAAALIALGERHD